MLCNFKVRPDQTSDLAQCIHLRELHTIKMQFKPAKESDNVWLGLNLGLTMVLLRGVAVTGNDSTHAMSVKEWQRKGLKYSHSLTIRFYMVIIHFLCFIVKFCCSRSIRLSTNEYVFYLEMQFYSKLLKSYFRRTDKQLACPHM